MLGTLFDQLKGFQRTIYSDKFSVAGYSNRKYVLPCCRTILY
jgi:hypothetical protein